MHEPISGPALPPWPAIGPPLHSEQVLVSALQPGGLTPLVVQATDAAADLVEWSRLNRQWIEAALLAHGAVLFRNFGSGDRHRLEQFATAVDLQPMHYMEGATPRRHLGEHVYTSTEFAPQHAIALHNELSYVLNWPMRIAFFCVVAAEHQGATPLADVRRVLARIPAAVREQFARKQWMLVRNFGDGFGPTWQDAYRVRDRAALEEYARESRITLEWRDGDRLRTRQVRPAIAIHPATGEHVWFNHIAFWHESSLEPELREVLAQDLGEEGLPYNTYYGDGTPIEPSVVAAIRAAYDAETIVFPWQRGDLVLADNMLVAHGRQPFRGQRTVLVTMGQPYLSVIQAAAVSR